MSHFSGACLQQTAEYGCISDLFMFAGLFVYVCLCLRMFEGLREVNNTQ